MGHELAVGGKAADCQPMWVRVWVRQLTRILTHTIFSIFATKKHRKPKFSMLFVVCRQKRCPLHIICCIALKFSFSYLES